MELYTLDPFLRREYVFDKYVSLLWTERWQAYGDFQLDIVSTPQTKSLLKTGTFLATNVSNYVMMIENAEDDYDEEGNRIWSISGRSIEAVMLDRVAKESTDDLTTSPTWNLTDLPAVVMRKIFHDICVTANLDPLDAIPFIHEGTFMGPSNIGEPVDPISVQITPMTVYDAIQQIGNVWNLGFRILRHYDQSELWFDVYSGSDRTTSQTLLPPVVFSPSLDNLQGIKELITIQDAKNVAYVYSPAGFRKVYAIGVDTSVAGFDRRVLVVDASDITEDSTDDVPSALSQRGTEELAKYRVSQALDGEISQNSQYKYGRDFYMGDLVEMRTDDGATNIMRVTEQIFAQDAEGERSYPTLAVNTFFTSGSWIAAGQRVWADYEEDEFWDTQP